MYTDLTTLCAPTHSMFSRYVAFFTYETPFKLSESEKREKEVVWKEIARFDVKLGVNLTMSTIWQSMNERNS